MVHSNKTRRTKRATQILVCAALCVGDASAFGVVSPIELSHHLPTAAQALSSMLHSPVSESLAPTTSFLTSSAQVGGLNPLEIAASIYRDELRKNPLETKVLTGIILAIVGDALAQSRNPAPYDVNRAVSFAAFDGCYRAVQQVTYPPMMQVCSGVFSSSLMGMLGVSTTPELLHILASTEQTLVSQLVIIPLIYYPCFFAITGAVQGLTVEETITRARETFIPLMKRNLLFWIPVQFLAFSFVEENLQIPILIVCGLVWTIILSISAGAAKTETAEELEVAGMEGAILEAEGPYSVMLSKDSKLDDPEKNMKEMERMGKSHGLLSRLRQGQAVKDSEEIQRR